MSRIIFENEYVIVVPTFRDVVPHKHIFYHIFFLGNEEECDEVLITGSGMVHKMPNLEMCRLFLMIDPTSNLADYLKEYILKDNKPKRFKLKKPLIISEKEDDEQISLSIKKWLEANNYLCNLSDRNLTEDYRVVKLIREIRDYKYLDKRIEEIADEYNISESRISHAFKENVGISLKGYLMLARLKYAYKLVMEGKSKTYAALEAGFSNPAHLAYTCKKEMGISITDVFK